MTRNSRSSIFPFRENWRASQINPTNYIRLILQKARNIACGRKFWTTSICIRLTGLNSGIGFGAPLSTNLQEDLERAAGTCQFDVVYSYVHCLQTALLLLENQYCEHDENLIRMDWTHQRQMESGIWNLESRHWIFSCPWGDPKSLKGKIDDFVFGPIWS